MSLWQAVMNFSVQNRKAFTTDTERRPPQKNLATGSGWWNTRVCVSLVWGAGWGQISSLHGQKLSLLWGKRRWMHLGIHLFQLCLYEAQPSRLPLKMPNRSSPTRKIPGENLGYGPWWELAKRQEQSAWHGHRCHATSAHNNRYQQR